MELVQRYLQAVKFWLPKDQKDDIAAELSADVQAQIEERQTALGRKLNEDEVAALLKERGRPVLVASRYLPPEHLIGPVLFPVYRFVLKVVLLCCIAQSVLMWTSLISIGVYSAGPGILGRIWGTFWLTGSMGVGVVTIVFAVLERVQAKSHFLEEWNPRRLPRLRDPGAIPRSGSAIDLAANAVFLVWWISNMSSPVVLNSANLRVTLSENWTYFFWGFLVLAVVNTALAGVNVMRPHWTVPRASVRLISNFSGAALFCWLMRSSMLAGFSAVNVSPERAVVVTHLINVWMARMLPFGVLLGVVIAAVDAYRITRLRPAGGRVIGEVTGMAALLLVIAWAAARANA